MYIYINNCNRYYGIRVFFTELREHNFKKILFDENKLKLIPENIEISLTEDEINNLKELADGSIVEVNERGLYVYFNPKSMDNTLFITNRCNSNCVMCPTSETIRKKSEVDHIDKLLYVCSGIENRRNHITITGGEPFLLDEDIFTLFNFLRRRLYRLDYLLLTNGRAFAIKEYYHKFCETMPPRLMLGIPLHGSNAKSHDAITQVLGSFDQTVLGIKRLLNADIKIELRIVVSKLNVNELFAISQFIVDNFKKIYKVTFIGLEMLGSARKNLEKVWVDYKVSFEKMKEAIDNLVLHGINVQIYNYPLCCVDSKYWAMCKKSISPEKVMYIDTCESCKVKEACGGIFRGTHMLMKDSIEEIK